MSGPSQDLKAVIDKLRTKLEQPAQTHGTVQRCTRDDLINMAAANQQRCAVSDETRALFELDT